jgi:flagellar biosynthetic protein FliR
MRTEFIIWMLVFVRISGLLTVLPIFSAANFPRRVRIALGAVTALLVTPTLNQTLPEVGTLWAIFSLLAVELGIGLLLGFVARVVFFALEFAASVIASEMGLSFSADMDPFGESRTQAPGLILYLLATMLFFSLDLHHWMLETFRKSYDYAPFNGVHLSEPLLVEVIFRTSRIFVVGVQMAAPIIAISLIITLTFSILGRAIPQMNVFGESFAFRTLAGMMLLGLTINLLAQHIINALRRIPTEMLRVAQLLGGG